MRDLVVTLATVALLLPIAAATAAFAEPSLEERCRAEVVELHQFLEEWFNAELPSTDEAFARFAEALDQSFVIIGPDGEASGYTAIVAAVGASHGRWSERPGRIRIENFRLHQSDGDLALATYEEWHELDQESGRVSSVLFGADEAGPNGLAWLHLHEVWIGPD